MVDTAARLIDEVLPPVPVRQWVLSLPFEIRYRLAWDGKLVSAVLAVFLRVVYGWYRRQAKGQGHDDGRCGSVSFVQRFGSALNLNPHFHVLMPDGVYVTGHDGTPRFVRTPQLTDDDVQQIVETTAKRVVRLLQRRGVLEEGNVDPLWEDEPLLATITAASVQGQIATGARAGQRVRRRLLDPEEGVRAGPLCFSSRGFSLHAATHVEATDRVRLEKLCRYVIRPPLAAGRLQILDAEGGRPSHVAFSLKSVWSDGTYQIVLSPEELLEKLAALVPPPRLNLVRYHGVLAPNATDRAQIVPGPQPVEETDIGDSAAETTPAQRRHRLAWAVLLARVFQFDVTVCDRCGGPVKIVAALTDPGSIRRYLEGVGLPARAPPIAPARPHAQQEFDMEYSGSAA